MPIDTSIITGTQPHKHTIDASDGGFLDVNSITGATSLTEGGIIQGDNSNQMANLAIGTPAQALRVNGGGTALEYYTPTDVGESLTNKGDLHTCSGGSVQTSLPVSVTDGDVLTVSAAAGSGVAWAALPAGGASCSDSLTISGQTNTLCKWLELGA
tara:strand:+ start:45 stop:512 length:468 start_codon:yes stop_codon:yes gene_type:complete